MLSVKPFYAILGFAVALLISASIAATVKGDSVGE